MYVLTYSVDISIEKKKYLNAEHGVNGVEYTNFMNLSKVDVDRWWWC